MPLAGYRPDMPGRGKSRSTYPRVEAWLTELARDPAYRNPSLLAVFSCITDLSPIPSHVESRHRFQNQDFKLRDFLSSDLNNAILV
jgi:hypothetical protein